MKSCVESYHNLLEILHNICIYSNIFYIIAGLMCFMNFKKYYKVFGIFLLTIATVSIIHHSNKKVIMSQTIWSTLDIVLANTCGIVAILTMIYLLSKKKTHVNLAITTILMGVISIVFFIFSEIEAVRLGNTTPSDPIKSWGGKIFTTTDFNKDIDYTEQSQQAMYLCYHTIWHILSGLTAIIWTISIISKPVRK